MSRSSASFVFVTAPNVDVAATLAHRLVEERLCACANLIPSVRSIYRWKGAISDEMEALLVLKTSAPRVAALQARIGELHPYEVPEALEVPVESGPAAYLQWLSESTRVEGVCP